MPAPRKHPTALLSTATLLLPAVALTHPGHGGDSSTAAQAPVPSDLELLLASLVALALVAVGLWLARRWAQGPRPAPVRPRSRQ